MHHHPPRPDALDAIGIPACRDARLGDARRACGRADRPRFRLALPGRRQQPRNRMARNRFRRLGLGFRARATRVRRWRRGDGHRKWPHHLLLSTHADHRQRGGHRRARALHPAGRRRRRVHQRHRGVPHQHAGGDDSLHHPRISRGGNGRVLRARIRVVEPGIGVERRRRGGPPKRLDEFGREFRPRSRDHGHRSRCQRHRLVGVDLEVSRRWHRPRHVLARIRLRRFRLGGGPRATRLWRQRRGHGDSTW